MFSFKCKMCGGNVMIDTEACIGICENCGTQQTLPKINDDRRANLYDRANHFRRNNEYDKAEGIYEQLLNEDVSDAEAYWSLVLCKYGVEYVEDPMTHRRIPTVNRTQYTTIFDDVNYKQALKYADSSQRTLYEQEAKSINEIQKGILAISHNEEPYDIFICYKESDANGKRTPDSVLANDLYYQLDKEGYRVFFSRISLEDKIGSAYEPYIFAALNSAKVMIVLGTRPEYFNAPWVKNEWSRYLKLVRESRGEKTLIPAYRDMDPYDMPEEFSHLQALDMSRLGFSQDLIHGLKKLIRKEKTEPEYDSIPLRNIRTVKNVNPAVDDYLQRGQIYLEDGDFVKANRYFDKVLDIDVENAEAYLGKLLAELKLTDESALSKNSKTLEEYINFRRAVRYGDEILVRRLKDYNEEIKTRVNQKKTADTFKSAMDMFNYASGVVNSGGDMNTINDARIQLGKAKQLFQSISGYKTSDVMVMHCEDYVNRSMIQEKESIYKEAVHSRSGLSYDGCEKAKRLFASIRDWKDSEKQIEKCNEKEKLLDRLVLILVISVIVVITILLAALKHNTVTVDEGASSFGEVISHSLVFIVAMSIIIACTAVFCLSWIRWRHYGIKFWKNDEPSKKVVVAIGAVSLLSFCVALYSALPERVLESLFGLLGIAVIVIIVYIKRS